MKSAFGLRHAVAIAGIAALSMTGALAIALSPAAATSTVTGVSFSADSYAVSSTAANWTVLFTTSNGGALSSGDTITVTFPTGFDTSGVSSATLGDNFASCSGADAPNISTGSGTVVLTLGTTCAIGNSQQGSIEFSGVSGNEGNYPEGGFSVSTTADAGTGASTQGNISLPGVSFSADSFTAGDTTANWTVDFTTSASGALDGASGDYITITFPAGFDTSGVSAIGTLGGDFSGCTGFSAPVLTDPSSTTVKVTLTPGCSIADSSQGTIQFSGIAPVANTYPASAFSTSTSQDSGPSYSTQGAISITAANTAPSGVSFSPFNSNAQVTTSYTVSFTPSSVATVVPSWRHHHR